MFYNFLHLGQDTKPTDYMNQFYLVNFNGVKVAKVSFLRSETLTSDCVQVIINGAVQYGRILDDGGLLGRISLVSPEENSRQINDCILSDGLDLRIKKTLMHLGIDNSKYQEILKYLDDEPKYLIYIFDYVFPGENIKEKIEIYNQKKIISKDDPESLIILDKIFKNGFAAKISYGEISLDEIPEDFKFNEFKIASKSILNLEAAFIEAIKNDNELLARFLFSEHILSIFKNIQGLVVFVYENCNESMIKFVISKCKIFYPHIADDIIISAAEKGYESLVMDFLLKDRRPSLNYLLEKIALVIGKNDNRSLFITFLSNYPNFLEKAVISAVKNGHESFVSYFLETKTDMTEDLFGNLVVAAAESQSRFLIETILSKGIPISCKNLGKMIISLAGKGEQSLIQFLLKEPEMISDKDLGEAVFFAVYCANDKRYLNTVKFLLEYKEVPIEYLEKAIKASISEEEISLEMFLLLFPEDKIISPINLKCSIKLSALYSKEEIYIFLLSKVEEFSREYYDYLLYSLEFAAISGSESIIRFILSKYPDISPDSLGEALHEASKNGKECIVRFLLAEYKTISAEYIIKSFLAASINGSEEIVKIILSTGIAIPPKSLEKAIDLAVKNRRKSLSKFFLSNYPEAKSKIIHQMFLNLDESAIKSFLDEGESIEVEKFNEVVIKAVEYNRYSLVKTLLSEDRSISSKDLCSAIVIAQTLDDNNIFNFLISKLIPIKIPMYMKKDILKIAGYSIDLPVELFIGKIINDEFIKIAESINIDYANKFSKAVDINDLNDIKAYLNCFLSEYTFCNYSSKLLMGKEEVLLDFANRFNLELIKESILNHVRSNFIFKEKIAEYYKKEFFSESLLTVEEFEGINFDIETGFIKLSGVDLILKTKFLSLDN